MKLSSSITLCFVLLSSVIGIRAVPVFLASSSSSDLSLSLSLSLSLCPLGGPGV